MSPSLFERKARRLPSGLKAGEVSDALFAVRRREAPEATSTSYRSAFAFMSSPSYAVTA